MFCYNFTIFNNCTYADAFVVYIFAQPALSIIYFNFNSQRVFVFVVVEVSAKRDGNLFAGRYINFSGIFYKLRSCRRRGMKFFLNHLAECRLHFRFHLSIFLKC